MVVFSILIQDFRYFRPLEYYLLVKGAVLFLFTIYDLKWNGCLENTSICFIFQTLEETITVIIPQNAKNVYDSIVEIIDSFRIIIKDPKTAITKIGKGAMT